MPPAASPPRVGDLREVVKKAPVLAWYERNRRIQTMGEGVKKE